MIKEKTKWKDLWISIGGMASFYLFYKLISLIILYSYPGLQNKPSYQTIYFILVLAISFAIYIFSQKIFHKKINIGINFNLLLATKGLIFIVPIILFGLDFVAVLPEIFSQPITLVLASVLSALGAGIFEEIRDRGFGINGLVTSLPHSKWKPLLIAVISSLLFSASHYFNLLLPNAPTIQAVNQQVFYTFFLGMCLAVLTLRTGTIFYAIIFHFMNNLTVWSPTADLAQASPWGSLIIIYGVIPLIYSLWCLRPKMMDTNLRAFK